MADGYHQVLLHPEDSCLTAFSCHLGTFRYNKLPFGLSNAPMVFQKIMDTILQPFPEFCFALLDDILIFSKTIEEHKQHLHRVLTQLEKHNVKLNSKKCAFFASSLEFIGFDFLQDKIRITREKLQKIEDIARPTGRRQLQKFLGFFNYFSRFVDRYSERVAPMYALLKKGVKFIWNDRCESEFMGLKKYLMEHNELNQIDNEHDLLVETDASGTGVGAMIYQVIGGGKRVIEYYSKEFNKHQIRYSVVEKEALAVLWTLRKYKFLLIEAFKFG